MVNTIWKENFLIMCSKLCLNARDSGHFAQLLLICRNYSLQTLCGAPHNVLKDGGYILPIPTVTYRISKPLTNGMVYLRKNKACSKSAVPLQFALDYVYQDLKQKHAKYQHIWDKKQRYKWDRQPITNEQIALIHKLAPDYKIDTHKMTRGDASRAIQLLTYKPEEWTPQTTPSEVQDDAKKSP